MLSRPTPVHVVRVAAIFAAVAVVCLVLRFSASAAGVPPLSTEDFSPAAQEGLGDRNNSWTWSAQWFAPTNQLYIGDNRVYGCVVAKVFNALEGSAYPPSDPDLTCQRDPGNLPLAAEIWGWDPTSNAWSLRYTSPYTIPNPSSSEQGKFLPPDIGFRTVTVYTDTLGTPHMVFGGVTAGAMGFGPVPPPRLLDSTDGIKFRGIPADPGTFLGSLSQVSMRGITDFNNQLFVINGNIQGAGPIIASLPGSNPLLGDNNWAQASPATVDYYNLATFNGYIYAGVVDEVNGYSVVKTNASGTMPYNWTTVVSDGGGLTPNPSQYPITMVVYNDRLYVGTVSPPELIRINADDTWDLVVGTPRQYQGQWKYPLSGIGEQYMNQFNDHIWRLGTHGTSMFSGTYNSMVRFKGDPEYTTILPAMGFDLYRSDDGWHQTAVSLNGMGNGFDYGVRNFADTPFGLFFGSANEYTGLQIFHGVDGPTTRLPSPQRLDNEVSHNQPVLSWDPVSTAATYHVWRAPFTAAMVTNSVSGPPIAYTFPGTFVDITQPNGIPDTVYVDQTLTSTLPTYEYYVTAVDGNGNVSDQSNVTLTPSYWPPTTFTSLESYIGTLQTRNRFVSSASYQTALSTVQASQTSALTNNDLATAFTQLQTLDTAVNAGSISLTPDNTDLDIMIAQLERRLKLANAGLVDVSSLQ